MRTPLLALALLAPLPAMAEGAVALRSHAIVTGPAVTLGDLFENAGARAAEPLGPAPAPGQHWLLEAPQLALIARDHGLAWRPLSADQRMVIERPGRALPREAVVEALLPELQARGAPAELDAELVGFTPPFLPEEAPEPRLVPEGTNFDPATRRFSTTLLVLADGMSPLRLRLTGRMVATRPAVVATRALRADAVIGPGDVALRRVPVDRLTTGVAEDPQAVVGSRLRRPIGAERPVPLTDLVPLVVLHQGAPVVLVHEVPGLALTAQGRALEDAAMGATIPVMNLATGMVVLAQVMGPDRARPLGPARTARSR